MNCSSNTKQLQLCWLLYANDFDDHLVSNALDTPTAWISGDAADLTYDLPGATNVLTISQRTALYDNTSEKIYVCPAENKVFVRSQNREVDYLSPVRSYSISGQDERRLGQRAKAASSRSYWVPTPNVPAYDRISAINRPVPSQAFVFVDESQYTIDDGYFAVLVNEDTWQNYPAVRHGLSSGFSYADGHSETHRWIEPSTPGLRDPNGFAPAPRYGTQRNRDLQWVSVRYINPPN